MDDNRKIRMGDPEKKSKLENFWFYYKWHLIISVIVVFVIVVCTAQACSREKEDMSIVYAGSSFISAEQTKEIEALLSSALPKDIDGDGKKKVVFQKYQIYSEKELETPLEDGSRPKIDTAQNATNYSNFQSHLMTGQTNVCFLSKDIYSKLLENNRIIPLSEIFGEGFSASSHDGYGVRLGDTDFYKYNSVMHAMEADTVICAVYKTVNTSEKQYDAELEMFKAIVNYKVVD